MGEPSLRKALEAISGDGPRGVCASELARRHRRADAPLTADALERWLLAEQLATLDADGLLRVTERGIDVAAALTWID